MSDLPTYEHEFRVAHQPLWEHRDPGAWLTDLIETGMLMDRISEARSTLAIAGEPQRATRIGLVSCEVGQSLWKVVVNGPEWLLRFVCVAFNQHASQHPNDVTPEDEAERLERTLHPRRPSFTLRRLRQICFGLSDDVLDMPLVVADCQGDWRLLTDLHLPGHRVEGLDYSVPTFRMGEIYDSRFD